MQYRFRISRIAEDHFKELIFYSIYFFHGYGIILQILFFFKRNRDQGLGVREKIEEKKRKREEKERKFAPK